MDQHLSSYYKYTRGYRETDPKRKAFHAKKGHAKRTGVEFTIAFSQVVWPDVCPILGIPLVYGNTVIQDNSPSFDRIEPKKGYVPGNVAIISALANRLKSSAAPEQLRKIADWIDRNAVKITSRHPERCRGLLQGKPHCCASRQDGSWDEAAGRGKIKAETGRVTAEERRER